MAFYMAEAYESGEFGPKLIASRRELTEGKAHAAARELLAANIDASIAYVSRVHHRKGQGYDYRDVERVATYAATLDEGIVQEDIGATFRCLECGTRFETDSEDNPLDAECDECGGSDIDVA